MVSLGLSASEWTSLSLSSGVSVDTLARRLTTLRLAEFKLNELKEIIRVLRNHQAFQHNPYVARGILGALSSAKKQQLHDALKNILTFQLQSPSPQQQHQQPQPPVQQPSSAYGDAAMQQQYRNLQQLQQQQAQQRSSYAQPHE
jgi:hypothetical protein